MITPFRFIAIAGLLLGVGAATPAAAQGRGDHDTPAIERQSESHAWPYRAPECQTGGGWVMCRDENGYWQGDRYDPRFSGSWWNNNGDEWSWGGPGPLPARLIIDRLHRWNFDDLRDVKLAGDVYRVKAVDPYGRPVRLTVDAFSGRIIGSELR